MATGYLSFRNHGARLHLGLVPIKLKPQSEASQARMPDILVYVGRAELHVKICRGSSDDFVVFDRLCNKKGWFNRRNTFLCYIIVRFKGGGKVFIVWSWNLTRAFSDSPDCVTRHWA